MSRKIFLILFLIQIIFNVNSKAINLDINIYHVYDVRMIDFKPISGKYVLEADERIIRDFHKGTIVNISTYGDSVLLQIDHLNVGIFKEVSLHGRGFLNAFLLSNAKANLPTREYDDNLRVKSIDNKLQLINNVDLEHYIAGVVQSEGGGSSDDIEFFFVQAISCRTYALVNYLKHSVDGFNLCDEVHCQYYTGRCQMSDITRAVARTSGEVIVDTSNHMISAAFSSNCGGETVNSEDVWTMPTSYLKSHQDTFCTSMSKANWRKQISKEDFIIRLKSSFNFPIEDSLILDSALHFKQPHRKVLFIDNIPLKFMRREFVLRSTFFEIEEDGNIVVFKGRGFGHGVGLCQQGAIRMVDLGYDYHKIISYYYKGARIIHYSELRYNFVPQF